MNKIKLTFFLFISLFVGLISFIVLTYTEHDKVTKYGEHARELGHEVLELRDEVTQNAITDISNPYQLSAKLVATEKELQELHQSYLNTNVHSFLFNHLATQQLLEKFYAYSMDNIDTLDQIVGLSVARQFILQSLTNLFNNSDQNRSGYGIAANQVALLSSALQNNNIINIDSSTNSSGSPNDDNHSHSATQELTRLASTFTELDTQQTQLLSNVLSFETMEYLEEIEHGFMEIQNELKNLVAAQVSALGLLLLIFIITIFVMRVFELKRNSLVYQETADKAEKANDAKSLFLATMSHELRTPMNGVLGLAQIIKDDSKEPETCRQAQVIIDSGQHLVTILNDILDFSKVEQGKMELEINPFSVDDVVIHLEKTLGPLAEEKELSFCIKNNIPKDLQLVGDSARTRQILFNLAGNAIKFTPSGKVEIEFALEDTAPARVQILVTDTGIGIAEDKVDGIFAAFEQAELSTTRKFGGTGLGLSIVKQLVELMGGTITVFSQLKVGTQFSLSIPFLLNQISPEQQESAAPIQDTDLDGLSVLLVEDNKINAMVIRKFCESLNMNVQNAYDGLESLEKLAETQYDLIIMDNHMPKMSGVQAIEKIRNELKLNTVIFACTADVFKEAHDEFIASGANFVLTKPLQKNSLQTAVHKFQHEFKNNRLNSTRDKANQVPPHSNVTVLVRCPKDKLPMTEEELSTSELFVEQLLSTDEKIECLESLVVDINEQVDALIDLFSNGQPNKLYSTLHAVKGIGSEFDMTELLSLTKLAKESTRNEQMPSAELLQQLVNRLMVNSHQATRLINKLNKQRKTG